MRPSSANFGYCLFNKNGIDIIYLLLFSYFLNVENINDFLIMI